MDWSFIAGTLLGAAIVEGSRWLWSARERQDKFRLAALEKRLEVHQKGFSIWSKLIFSLYKPEEREKIVKIGDEWWNDNCLYLDEKSRSSFHTSLILAWDFDDSLRGEGRAAVYNKINQTGKYLVEGINLPFIADVDTKEIEEKTP